MKPQEKLFELVSELGFIPILTAEINKINILNDDKKLIGEFRIIDDKTLHYTCHSKKNSSGSCSFDEIGIIGVINKFL